MKLRMLRQVSSIIFMSLVSIISLAQESQITFKSEQIDFTKKPRTNISPMSMKLWDNYKSTTGPTASGMVLELYGKIGHQTSQLNFGGYDNSRIRYREAFYAQENWSQWRTLLDSHNDVESNGNLRINGSDASYIKGRFSIGTDTPATNAHLTVAGGVSSTWTQQNRLSFDLEQIDFSKAPRTTIPAMSMKLWDSYNSSDGPSASGVVLEVTGRWGHQASQLNFGGFDKSRIWYREAFFNEGWNSWRALLDSKSDVDTEGRLIIRSLTGVSRIENALVIGSGKHETGYHLTVAGKIAVQEVKIDITAGADFVFESDFDLKPLSEVESFIKENKHLPEIPSEKQMQEEGLSVNEFQIKLLQKIEELTLYTIEQDKQIKELQSIIDRNGLK